MTDRVGEIVLPQNLLDQPGHKADITSFSGLLNSNEVEMRVLASVLQVIDFVHQVPSLAVESERQTPAHCPHYPQHAVGAN